MADIIIKCKSCGSKITVDSMESKVYCDYCGNPYEIPQNEIRDELLNLYSRADNAWEHRDFDEALQLYEQIIRADNHQDQAHFAAALCRYGISYEVDPGNGRKVPTCNRFNRTSILDDKNYKIALKFASEENRASYEKTARKIDRITSDFLKIVDKEEPYDVFISYKRTKEDGSATEEQGYARKLYYFLTERKYKVFFAEITLQNMAGEKYEPYIFAALSSAPVMVLMGSSRDNLESTWVRNEWKRFLTLQSQGENKTLIPCCLKMDPYNLPGELRAIESMNVGNLTFCEDVVAIVEKKLASAKKSKPATEGISLAEKYATPDKVKRIVEELDCEEAHAVEVLINFQGKVGESIAYISKEDDYRKKLWVCAECGRNNTHDVCRDPACGLSKTESQKVLKQREAIKKNSAEERQKRAKKAKNVVVTLLALLLAGGVIFGIGSCISNVLIKPNQSIDDLYTPEIVQSYSGTYNSGGRTKGEGILTITSCDKDGNLTGYWEFIVDKAYGKYELTGRITSKKQNGKIVLTMAAGKWIVQPESFSPLEEMEITITDNYQNLTCSQYGMNWTVGGNEEYQIKTAADFKKLINAEGVFQIVEDIDLAGTAWTPIEGFKGILMGNGHTVKNLTVEASSSNVGMFSVLEGTVMNLKLENANITVTGSNENIGILCGSMQGSSVSDITVSGTVTAEKSTNVGGIAGSVTGNTISMTGLSNGADIVGGDYVAGVIGYAQTSYNNYPLTATASSNTGAVTGKTYVGGIFGYVSADRASVISDCSNQSAINAEAYVGGIAGKAKNVTINDCTNTGSTITANKFVSEDGVQYACVGGFAGEGFSFNNCTNEAEIIYTSTGSYVGGIAGYVSCDGTVSMSDLSNTTDISGADYVGGIFGGQDSDTVDESNFSNSGAITGSGNYIAGVIGCAQTSYNNYPITVTGASNTGKVTGKVYVGGIFGYVSADRASVISDCSNQSAINAEAYVGSIAGKAKNVTINDCTNTGSTITANKFVSEDGVQFACVGGFAGEGYAFNDCTNEAQISYTGTGSYVGGIAGYVSCDGTVSMSDLSNTMDISGADYVGGIFGGQDSDTVDESNFSNSGAITGGNYVSGIIGCAKTSYNNYAITVTSCSNTGRVTGKAYVGGIFGYISAKNGSKISYCTSTGSVSGQSNYDTIAGYMKNVTVQ